jgi:hypothetical protein
MFWTILADPYFIFLFIVYINIYDLFLVTKMEFISRLIDGKPIYLQNNLLEITEAWVSLQVAPV